jgi:hypothetical protein
MESFGKKLKPEQMGMNESEQESTASVEEEAVS